MNLYTTDDILLYESSYPSLQATLETAIKDGIILDRINLKNKDLRNINFDTVIMREACLVNADLTGANMSEAVLDSSDFSAAQLYNTCIAYASLKKCRFLETCFGATDFAQSILEESLFSGTSSFSILFRAAHSMEGVSFLHKKEQYAMETPPTHIRNAHHDVYILDKHILIGDDIHPYQAKEDTFQTINQSVKFL